MGTRVVLQDVRVGAFTPGGLQHAASVEVHGVLDALNCQLDGWVVAPGRVSLNDSCIVSDGGFGRPTRLKYVEHLRVDEDARWRVEEATMEGVVIATDVRNEADLLLGSQRARSDVWPWGSPHLDDPWGYLLDDD